MGCKAHIIMREYILYPDFSVTECEVYAWKLRTVREEKLKALRMAITSGKDIQTTKKILHFFASSPSDTSDWGNAWNGTTNAS